MLQFDRKMFSNPMAVNLNWLWKLVVEQVLMILEDLEVVGKKEVHWSKEQDVWKFEKEDCVVHPTTSEAWRTEAEKSPG